MKSFLKQLILASALCVASAAMAVSTTITYQGYLEDGGTPANGAYDFQFTLKNTGGSPVFPTITLEDVVVTKGVFTVPLDLGSFDGTDRKLGISVRAGASTGGFTGLLPDTVLTPAVYSHFANTATQANSAFIASDTTDYAIDEIDINSDAVSARTIQAGAVASSEIADNSITATDIAANSIGNSELADNSVGLANLIGANYTSPANFSATVGANSCLTGDINVSGGFEVGDVVVLTPLTVFPSNITVDALNVVSTNVVKMRFCNVGASSQTFSNMQVKMISIR